MPKNVTFPKCIGYQWNRDFNKYLLETLAKNDNCSVDNREDKKPLDIHSTVKLTLTNTPNDWTFKGYKSFIVQDIKIQQYNTEYLRAYYIDRNGKHHYAELPKHVKENGH